MEAYGVRAFAEALEVIPSTLAENAGLDTMAIVTELRNRHAQGETAAGINVRKVLFTAVLFRLQGLGVRLYGPGGVREDCRPLQGCLGT